MVAQLASEFLQVNFRFVWTDSTQLHTSQKLKWVRFVSLLVADLVALLDEGVQAVGAEEEARNWPKFEQVQEVHFHF